MGWAQVPLARAACVQLPQHLPGETEAEAEAGSRPQDAQII